MKAVRKGGSGPTKKKIKRSAKGGGSGPKKRTPIDWTISTAPTAEQIGDICEQYDLLDEDRRLLQAFCEDFVPYVKHLQEENDYVASNEAPLSKHRRDAIRHAEKIRDVIQWLENFGMFRSYHASPGSEYYLSIEGRNALSNAAEQCLSGIIDPWFLAGRLGGLPTGAVPAGESFNIEAASFSFASRNTFARNVVKPNPGAALIWTLSAVQATLHALSVELNEIAPKGGPRPRVIEPHLIMNLAFLFERMGRKPTSNPDGDFRGFVASVVEAFGHPSGWVASHLRQGILQWKQRAVGNSTPN